jgi:hypothetical protein
VGYYIDLGSISLDTYQKRLETTDLLPSQQLLKIDIEEKFKEIKSHSIINMFQLQQTLKTKEKVKQFSEMTLLPIDYLTVLRREINSYHPRPRKIKDFPGLSSKLKEKLVQIGVQTTVMLYDKTATISERDKLKKEIGATEREALLLTKLADVCRLRYVNETFATLLVSSEYDTVARIKQADYRQLCEALLALNADGRYFKGKFGQKDMKFLVDECLYMPLEVEY